MDKTKINSTLSTIFLWISSILVSGFFVKLMWNCLAPTLFNHQTLSYWEAIVLFALTQTLFTKPNE